LILMGLWGCSDSSSYKLEGSLKCVEGCAHAGYWINPETGGLVADDVQASIVECSDAHYFCFEGTFAFSYPRASSWSTRSWAVKEYKFEMTEFIDAISTCDMSADDRLYQLSARSEDSQNSFSSWKYTVSPKLGILRLEESYCLQAVDGICAATQTAIYEGCQPDNFLFVHRALSGEPGLEAAGQDG
jgi:hypothetical protein